MRSGPTVELAAFAAGLQFEDIPESVVVQVKLALIDMAGCVLYGSTLPWTRIVHDYVLSEQASGVSVLWGAATRTSPALAALANGTAAHGAEIDDLHKASFYHPTAVAAPAALAIADAAPQDVPVSGRELLASLVAGHEVGTRVGAALGQQHFTAGYHPQGTVGVFAAAAAAGRALGLGDAAMVHTLGIAGTQASGLMAAQEGAMVKRMHAGLACQTGVRAALLAQRGFTGIENVFEAEFGGLLSTLGTPESDPAALTAGLGTHWNSGQIEFKWHAACAAIHSSLDVVEDLRAESPISPADVERVRVVCTTHSLLHCGFPYEPGGVTGAQMSFQYCIAAMLTFGVVGVDQFADHLLADPDLLALARKVEIVAEPRFDALGPSGRHSVEVTIHSNGKALTGARSSRRGGVEDPVSPDRVVTKYRQLAHHVVDIARADSIVQTIEDIEHGVDARALTELLVVEARTDGEGS